MCKAPNFPKDESRGLREVALTRTVYIDRSDFKEEDSKVWSIVADASCICVLYVLHLGLWLNLLKYHFILNSCLCV